MRSARQTARTVVCPGCFASLRSAQGSASLALFCIYSSVLCTGYNLLTQIIYAAKSENPISLTRPSIENVGGLILSIYPIKSKKIEKGNGVTFVTPHFLFYCFMTTWYSRAACAFRKREPALRLLGFRQHPHSVFEKHFHRR